MVLPISLHPQDSILQEKTLDVDLSQLKDVHTQQLIDNMIDTMYSAQGIGIAAPQVFQHLRICIIGKEADASLSDDLVLVNPQWERTSRKKANEFEGCLSIPKTYGKVVRWKNIKISAYDRNGEQLNFEAHNFFARVIQHEVDHLDGILFIDKATGIHTAEVHP